MSNSSSQRCRALPSPQRQRGQRPAVAVPAQPAAAVLPAAPLQVRPVRLLTAPGAHTTFMLSPHDRTRVSNALPWAAPHSTLVQVLPALMPQWQVETLDSHPHTAAGTHAYAQASMSPNQVGNLLVLFAGSCRSHARWTPSLSGGTENAQTWYMAPSSMPTGAR